VDKFFQTLARLASSKEVLLAKSGNNSGSGEKESLKGKISLATLVNGYFYSPSLKFTRIWQVWEWLSAPRYYSIVRVELHASSCVYVTLRFLIFTYESMKSTILCVCVLQKPLVNKIGLVLKETGKSVFYILRSEDG
jgi:hypothetical protein